MTERKWANTEPGSSTWAAALIRSWLGLTAIHGVPSVNPACSLSSHCIGVRALSRLLYRRAARTVSGSAPAPTASWKWLTDSRSRKSPIEAKREVRHPQLLPLVDVGGPPVQVEDGRQGLGGALAVGGVVGPEAADGPRLVVVVEVEAVPAALGQALLPAAEGPLEVEHPQRAAGPTCPRARSRGRRVRTGTTMSSSRLAGSVYSRGLLQRHARHLADRRAAPSGRSAKTAACISWRNSSSRGPQMTLANWAPYSGSGRHGRVVVVALGDEVDDVHPEAVDTPVEPPPHHRVDGLSAPAGFSQFRSGCLGLKRWR